MNQIFFKILCMLGLRNDRREDHDGRLRWVSCVASAIDDDPEFEELEYNV